ncbi:MAG: LacI family DNA-binding transcriptional regulator [Clostridia bacterium]|nr:LacI family DNA-binding transcriptional regulator [Clostridia bacterium]MBQ4274151.1 LacI family DNA-binding transcriptional regulator [Clostridia bacterium]
MTIKEIAAELGLSASTVSKALNNASDISVETRNRVNNYARSIGFSLHRNQESKRICVLFENMDSHSNSQVGYPVLTGFQQAANAYHYEVIIEHCSDKNPPNLKKLCQENNFCGLMILGTKLNSAIIKELESTNIPAMLMDSYVKNPKVACISSDNINSVAAIVEHLIGLGHRKIGFLGGDKDSIVTRERFSGYLIGLMEGDIEFNSSYVRYGNYTENCGLEAADDFAEMGVTAVVCASDLIAIGLISGLRKRGLHVPEDISVSGFDNLDVARYFTPSLTTVKQDFISLGENAFTLLRQAIKGNKTKRITIHTEPIFRDSTAPAKTKAVSPTQSK